MADAIVSALTARFGANVVLPTSPDYGERRRVWNGMIDRWPAGILSCTDRAMVREGVLFAREHGLALAVRGGGHNVAGNATCDGGLVLDLSPMRAVGVDGKFKFATAEGGATWRDYDWETYRYRGASPGGLVSSTGVGGLTLGGGFGYLSRKWGLASDVLQSIELVSAAGDVVRASRNENPELFWGLRGGGGNFGVATKFEFRVRALNRVCGGIIGFPFAHARPLLRAYRDICADAPDDLTVYASLITLDQKLAAFLVCSLKSAEETARLLAPLRAVATPYIDTVGMVEYYKLQQQLDAGYPAGLRNYWKSNYLAGFPDEVIDLYIDAYAHAPSPTSQIIVEQMGGRITQPPYGDTAFDQREAPFNAMILSMWQDPAADEPNIAWVRDLFARSAPFSNGGVYVNYLGEGEQDRLRAAYRTPAKWDRLVALKRQWDSTNLFRLNQNIQP